VQVQELERVPALHDSVALDLDRLVSDFRVRLGLERLACFGIRGAMATAVVLVALAFAIWLTGEVGLLALAAAPLLVALALAAWRWPTRRETALVVDRRFALEERLATAVELLDGNRHSRFSALQVHDTLGRTRNVRSTWLTFDARARNEAALALVGLALAAAALVLVPRLPHPALTTPVASDAVDTPLPPPADDLAQRALPLETPDQSLAIPATARPATQPADLAARVQQEQAERSALDKLAQALGDVSAGQPAADAIRQGNFDDARNQLQNLADNADQLSSAAKQQLSRALQQAAADSAQADRGLADREQQAAQALARSAYTDQRQALRALADQVQRSGARSVPSDQLEREVGQLQQQTSGAGQNTGGASRTSSAAAQSGATQSGVGQGEQLGGTPGGQGDQPAGIAAGGQNGDGAGEQSGAGVGTGTDPNLYSDQPSRLDTAGQRVQVPLKLGNGPGVRPADGTEDQAVPDPGLGGRTISEVSQTQQTGQVAPEQNLVPGEQRPVVRGYFR
jgi:hypothetical protein